MQKDAEYCRPRDAAKILDVDPSTLRRYARSGDIRYRRLPSGDFRYHRGDCELLSTASVATFPVVWLGDAMPDELAAALAVHFRLTRRVPPPREPTILVVDLLARGCFDRARHVREALCTQSGIVLLAGSKETDALATRFASGSKGIAHVAVLSADRRVSAIVQKCLEICALLRALAVKD